MEDESSQNNNDDAPRPQDSDTIESFRHKRRKKLVFSSDDNEPRTMEWRLYTGNKTFQEGDLVFVRPKSAREIGIHGRLLIRCKNEGHKWKLVILSNGDDANADKNGKEILVDEHRLIPVFSSSSSPENNHNSSLLRVLITSKTKHYRQLAASQLGNSDAVLEIGCSTGGTSEVVWKRASSWVGLDTSSQMVERTLSKYAAMTGESTCRMACHKIDALQEPEQALQIVHQHQQQQTSVVLMDIGGNREMNGVARMMKWIFTCQFPQLRLIVVKSEEFVRELTSGGEREGMLVRDGMEVLEQKLLEARRLPPHPLQAHKAYNPKDPSQPICRYHNYHKKGCSKGSSCPFDHVHCHMCLESGHVAIKCNQVK